ncbi:hypothetical protein HAX54_045945 [Datura stramonium]|uniref:Uncharacterized protein n=1 Tax=Datura stramonium TaxID=4076 RepID=A0ABS8SQQ6_DATST|nr:hypothetical protein [Datura stramonium]
MTTVTDVGSTEGNYVEALQNYYEALRLEIDPYDPLMLFAGWFHYHKAAPKLAWFQDVESMLNHHLATIDLGLHGASTHHMYSMPPYPYLATDYGTQLSVVTHHMWISGFLIAGAAAHAAIFMVRDYDPTTRYNDLLDRVFRHRDASSRYVFRYRYTIITRLLNGYKNTMLVPLVQRLLGATASTSLTWWGGDQWQVASSCLIPDKANLGFRFPCDGPGRGSDVWGSVSDQGVVTHITGGNLGRVLLLLMGGSAISYGHRHPRFSQGLAQESITVVFGLLGKEILSRGVQDPLHVRPIAHAIWDPHFGQPAVEAFTRGGALGPVNIAYSVFISGGIQSVYALMKIFILALFFYYFFRHILNSRIHHDRSFAHGAIFFIRDYNPEQNEDNVLGKNELIETLAWAHERTPLANLFRWRDKPVALSIVQARLVD